ncbi:hypothetical protein IscW_ISCW024146, partial [Ixodes scapularis]
AIEPYVCSKFNRRPRGLSELDRCKATEFRKVVLYTGPIILHSKIPEHLFANFVVLHVAVNILRTELVDYAGRLLIYFIKTFASLYGWYCIPYSIHNLIHLASDVHVHGELQNWSAFLFEN